MCGNYCNTSEPGVTSKHFTSDGNWSEYEPRIITVFLAMHDILDEAMGQLDFVQKHICLIVFQQ